MLEGTYITSGGPIFLGVMILLSQILKWPRWTNYIWGASAILWGIITLV